MAMAEGLGTLASLVVESRFAVVVRATNTFRRPNLNLAEAAFQEWSDRLRAADEPCWHIAGRARIRRSMPPELVRRRLLTLYPDGRLQTEEGLFPEITESNFSGVQESFDYPDSRVQCSNRN